MSEDDHAALLRAALHAELPAAAALRRQLHAHPDLPGEEDLTRESVLAALPAGLPRTQVAGTGALVRVGTGSPAVAVRAELDALAIGEETGLPWASQRPGVMHACGHDVHLAALSALVNAISAVGGPADLLAVLQPREETYPSGAQDIVTSGLLEAEGCAAMVGAHVQPLLPAGVVACTAGAVNASADEFTVTVRGTGGHAAYPHLTRDPVVALAHVVVALQSIVSRSVDPLSPAVLTVSTLTAGSVPNAVPDVALARGIVRTMSDRDRTYVHQRLGEVASATSRAHGCSAEVQFERGEPVLENDAALAADTARVLGDMGFELHPSLRSMGADDFAFFAERMPSLMAFVGVHGSAGLHSSTFAPPEGSVRDVAYAMLAGYLAACRRVLPSAS